MVEHSARRFDRGLVLGGILAIAMGTADWQMKVGLILIPTIIYFVMLIKCEFPENERVAAGVSYKEMLAEIGALGALIISAPSCGSLVGQESFPLKAGPTM